ncbi:MAG: DUF6350 family protein, partial [Actinomycetota bacterium]|nr:DUF6350 family protein [Actinomycetota bacterium]
PAVWVLMALTPLVAGAAIARIAYRSEGLGTRFGTALGAALLAALVLIVLTWQGGGAIGGGRLSTVGASPAQVGLAVGAALAVASAMVVSVGSLRSLLTHRRVPATVIGWRERLREQTVAPTRVHAPSPADEPDEGGQLAG